MNALRKILQKIHIIEDTEGEEHIKDPKAPRPEELEKVKVTRTRVVTIDELKNNHHRGIDNGFDNLVKAGEEITLSLDEIFERAHIKPPPHGWTIQKVFEMVETDEFAQMGEQNIKLAINGAMKHDRVKPEDVLHDAVARDQVLDSYEKFLAGRIEKNHDAFLDENTSIDRKIEELKKKKEENLKSLENEKAYFDRWKKEKVQYEQSMAKGAAFLDAHDLVSIGSVTEKKE